MKMNTTSPRTGAEFFGAMVRERSPQIWVTWLALAITCRLLVGNFETIDLWLPIALWQLGSPVEVLFHIYILHDLANHSAAREHRLHHRDPDNPTYIFIPFMVTLLAPPIILAGLLAILGPFVGLPAALTAVITVYIRVLVYEIAHFLAHCPTYTPRASSLWGRIVQRIRKHHRLHHFQNEKFYMEVASLIRWAGFLHLTICQLRGRVGKKIPPSPTVKTFGVAIDATGATIAI